MYEGVVPPGAYSRRMFYGLGAFFLIAILCVVIGVVAMRRSKDYGDSDGGGMTDAEFRKIEGFDD